MNVDAVAKAYPAFAGYLNIPEIRAVFEGVQPGDNAAKVLAALQATQWWRGQSQAQRAWASLELSQPGEADRRTAQQFQRVAAASQTQGVRLPFDTLAHITHDSLVNGWDDTEILRRILAGSDPRKLTQGDLRASADQLVATARAYGVAQSDQTIKEWSRRIATNAADMQGYEAFVRNQAMALFPTLKAELQAGSTVADIFEPYRQAAAQTLGLNPTAIDMTSPRFARALQRRDGKGTLLGPMDISEWQRTLMTDPTYGYNDTPNGKLDAYKLRSFLGQTFGELAS